jgi:hypothetical protein
MEREVPHSRVRAQPVEDGRAGYRGVHDDQVRDVVAKRLRVGVSDHEPDVVTDDGDRLGEAHVLVQKTVNVAGHGSLVVAPGRTP